MSFIEQKSDAQRVSDFFRVSSVFNLFCQGKNLFRKIC